MEHDDTLEQILSAHLAQSRGGSASNAHTVDLHINDDVEGYDAGESAQSDGIDDDDEMYDSDFDDAQEQWDESVEQLRKLFTLVLLPVTGKFFGRKFAYFAWAKYVAYENSLS